MYSVQQRGSKHRSSWQWWRPLKPQRVGYWCQSSSFPRPLRNYSSRGIFLILSTLCPCACSLLCQSQLLTRTNPTKQDFLTLCNNRKASFSKGGGQLKGSYAEDREVRRIKQQPMKMYPVYTIHTRYILASYFASFLPHSPSKMIDKSFKLLGHWRIWISSRNSPNHSI